MICSSFSVVEWTRMKQLWAYVCILGVVVSPTWLNAQTQPLITEYEIPTPNSSPGGITTGPDGALWFTESVGKIGRVTTGGVFTEYPTGSSSSCITTGPDGALWFTGLVRRGNVLGIIGRLTTAGSVTEYAIQNSPGCITTGSDGALWFIESPPSGGGKIGRITTAGVITEYAIPAVTSTISALSSNITTGPDGALWFIEYVSQGGKIISTIARMTTTGAITEYPMPTSSSSLGNVISGPDGALWFTEANGNNVGKIGRITTSGAITEYTIPEAQSSLGGITTGPDGAVWFTELTKTVPGLFGLPEWTSPKIARMTTTGAITEYAVPTANSFPESITTGPDGAMWFTQSLNEIGRIATTGASSPIVYGASLPLGEIGAAYSAAFNAVVGTPPYGRWLVSSGSLPPGLALDASNGAISGAPSAPGVFNFSVTVEDKTGAKSTAQSFSITISPAGCSYAISPVGQAFPPSGGTGAITVTAAQGCAWTGTGPAWVTFTSALSGTGSGVVTFQVRPSGGGDLSGTFTIAGQIFTVEQAGASIAGLVPIGSLAQEASGGTWNLELEVINLGKSAATARLNFAANDGSALTMPLTFPQTTSAGPELASTLDRTLSPNALLQMDSTGPAISAPLVGWAQLLANGNISGFGIFSDPLYNWDAVVPLETRSASKYILPFDNTGSLATGLAIANIATQAASVPVIIRNEAGSQIGTAAISLAAHGHTSFMLNDPQLGYSVTNNIRGSVEFDTPTGGQISLLALRANGPALTTLPVLSNVDTSGGSITHVTYHGGFTSTFYLVNRGSSPASFTLSFFDENGNPLTVPLSLPQSGATTATSAFTQTLAAGALLEIDTQAQDTLPLVQGSAQLTTAGSIGGFEIYRWTTFEQETAVPLETRTPNSFVLVFDNTNALATGVALANIGPLVVTVTANIYDDLGNLLQTANISLPGQGHTSFMLPTNYPVTAGKRGSVQFSGGRISVIGVRATTAGTLTTIPLLVK